MMKWEEASFFYRIVAFRAIRYLQISYGYFMTFFNDKYGQYHVQEGQFYLTCYKCWLLQRTEISPINQQPFVLSKVKGTAVVIGANRGIGLGFAKQYLETGYEVVATYRDESKLGEKTTLEQGCEESLEHLKQKYTQQLTLHKLEITDEESIAKFAKTVTKVDLLVLNAGIKGYPASGARPPDHTSQHLSDALRVNTQAPDSIIRFFYPLLARTADACVVYKQFSWADCR